ncbi:ATP-dependent DNA helicase mph1 [Drechslerella dactyloides]|uniref:ATP-dependent DNA helicase n=1 Tax=Drechslerella dactyloides TaxID=74499 RepID=A0AAD6IW20_DREDA|nr:ATP-dependent DNA helicase mph1 [Drechslerella dactyloides]
MSFLDDDDYDDDLDDELLIGAAEQFEESIQQKQPINPRPNPPQNRTPKAAAAAAPQDEYDLEGIFSSDLIDEEDDFRPVPAASRTSSSNLRQRTLFGDVVNGDDSTETTNRGWRLVNHNEPPTHHKIDREAAKTWIYPTNVSHRDYQFNITKRALFTNVLVALPTGLGKTFIAATVMYNWYRWAPESQIIFMAPTKPLVAQQVDACHKIVGIPKRETCLLTGHVSTGHRADYWNEKRVFFMTPQTLETDLTSGRCDPKRIVLIVVDEAHRATGEYAYCKVIRYIRRFNNSFRVMALTATPGSKVESVQEVITSLGVARTEIRTEESLDIRGYIHQREIQLEKFPLSDELTLIKDQFGKALKPMLKKLNDMRVCYITEPSHLTAFALTEARKKYFASPAARTAPAGLKGSIMSLFANLSSLAYGYELLLYHGIRPFYEYVRDFQNEKTSKSTGGGKVVSAFFQDKQFLSLMNRCRALMNEDEFLGHPKLDYLCGTILRHFTEAAERGETDTKVIVFSNYRKSGEEILRVLKKHEPIIKPRIFVGQSAGKNGEGMSQKVQQDTVERFKKGEFNVLVATSIGEEGLDIGEVDFIVCFDASASPIRMLQRMGRTGRKRAGGVVVLVTEGKEESKWERAQDNYRWMQNAITQGNTFTYDKDISPRILPGDIDSECVKMVIEITPESGETSPPAKRKGKKKAPPKKWHMPDGVETGFTTAATLGGFTTASKKAKKAKNVSPEPHLLSGDDEDFRILEDLEEEPFPETIPEEAYLLSERQQRELRSRYQAVYGLDDEVIAAPQIDAHPESQRTLQPTGRVGHSRATKSMVVLIQKMRDMGDYDIAKYQGNLDVDDICVPPATVEEDEEEQEKSEPEIRPSQITLPQACLHNLKPFKPPSRVSGANRSVKAKPAGAGKTKPKKTSKREEAIQLISSPPPPQLSSSPPPQAQAHNGKLGRHSAASSESDEDMPSLSQLLGEQKRRKENVKESMPSKKRKAEPEPAKKKKRVQPEGRSFQLNIGFARSEGDYKLDLPPPELFAGGRTQRFLWSEPNDVRICLIDWSMPDTTNQPFGVRKCVEQAEKADMGEYWVLGKNNKAKDKTKDFEGMIGSAGTGRCMQWRPAPANETWNPSPFDAVTYGNITSEPCDVANEYQYFEIPGIFSEYSSSGVRPKAFKHECPEDMQPTILTAREAALVVYGCGKGVWFNWPICAAFGWYYYNITSAKMELVNDGATNYQEITCCLADAEVKKRVWCNSVYEDGTKNSPMSFEDYWNGICTDLFPNYVGYTGPWTEP